MNLKPRDLVQVGKGPYAYRGWVSPMHNPDEVGPLARFVMVYFDPDFREGHSYPTDRLSLLCRDGKWTR